jgi:hypothetical protein
MAKNDTKDSQLHYVLPSDNESLQITCRKFKIDMMEQVVNTISFAVKNELPMVEVFQFKDSDFFINIAAKDYLTNLENIYSYYLANEEYEKCARVVVLQKTIKENVAFTTNNEKTKVGN